MKANMKRMLVLVLLLMPFCISRSAYAAEQQPNVLLIFTDDHGWADLGAQGVNAEIRTPNLDRLASDGVRFTRGYVTAPQCTPSRAGVMSGRYQQRFGVEHNGIGMPASVVTLPERLKAAGYVTGFSGKWHLDIENASAKGKKMVKRPEMAPWKQGFDEYFAGEMSDYRASHALDDKPFADAPHGVRDTRFRVVIQTDAVISFLRRRAAQSGQPWFVYLGWFAPHVPLESPEPWFSKTPANLPKERRQALAMIAAMDDGLGRIREQLKKMGQEQNTLIFIIGDNGAPLGKAWDGSINLPLKGEKGMLSEGGIRTPFVAAWPGHIPAGQVYDKPVISLDVAATAVALAGQPHDNLDGVNLVPFLTGANNATPHETLYWRWMSQAAIQEFPWKLIQLDTRERLLFDVTTPEGENVARNMIKEKPEIAARLQIKLAAWCAQLQPPGFSDKFDAHHEGLFAEHELIEKLEAPPTKVAADGTIQGWFCRNGTLAVKNSALVLTPAIATDSKSRPFLTNSGLDLLGPVHATLRVRATQGGPSAITWRTKTDSFTSRQSASFDLPASTDWREVKVELAEQGRIIHVRIMSAQNSTGIEIQSIELRDKQGQVKVWRFDAPQ